MDSEYFTVEEAAKELGVSKTWIHKLLETEKLTKFRRMGKTLILKEEVADMNKPKRVVK